MSSTKDRLGTLATRGQLSQPSIPMTFGREVVEDLLYGFDVNEDEREFLTSLIADNKAPRDEVEKLYDLSLMSGVEDWDMLMQCATSLRDYICNRRYGSQLTPYLAVIHLQKQGRWATLGGDAHIEPQPKPRNEQWRKSLIAKAAIEKPRGPRSLQRHQTTSHFFSDETETTNPLQRQQSSFRREGISTLKANGRPSGQPPEALHGASVDGSRRARGVVSAGAFEGMSPAPGPPTQQESVTAGHFLPPRKCDENSPLLLHTGVNNTINGYDQAKGTEVTTEDGTPKRKRNPRADRATTSHFFDIQADSKASTSSPSPGKRKTTRPARGTLSALPIPPLSATRFGLIQEELADNPFQLLIAITFLIRTAGRAAIPVFRELIAHYPTPEALAAADPADIIPMIHHLGLSSNRCAAIQKYARIWMERPPVKDVRYGVKNYPRHGDGKDVKLGEEFGAEDNDVSPDIEEDETLEPGPGPSPRTKARGFGTSWEIGHLTQGPYAIDSWRIFCRDVLLGRAEDWKGKGRAPDFQPEWMRVLPQDKELRACLRWMWMREGWSWDPLTGEREVLSERTRRAVDEGRVAYDNQGQLRILDESGEALDDPHEK